MENMYLWALSVIFCLITYAFATLSPDRRYILLRRFQFRNRRASSAATPPRSVSPSKKPQVAVPSPAAYINLFPPSRRNAFIEVVSRSAGLGGKDRGWDPSRQITAPMMMPFEASYLEVEGSKHTPCGLSVDEIKALGDFPDYATLSGVPLPEAYQEFDIAKAHPRPYRPFRWPYHQTMAQKRLENNWWIELESSYRSRISQRKKLYEENGQDVLQWLPGSELACKELMEMVLQFLAARYPQYFTISDDKNTLTNHILGSVSDIRAKHPLLILLDHVPEDFAAMLRHPQTGYYVFRAGVICSALGWSVGSKIGKQLHEIHGPIPDYKEKLQFSMDRFFAKMPTDQPIQRGSWGLEVDTPLYMPPGDPHEEYREVQSPSLELSRCHLRVDWQTLRRLPLSGAIIFNFKAVFTPVQEFRDEPFIPALLTMNLKKGKENLMKYKNTWHVEHVCLPALEKWTDEQVAKGTVPEDWEVETLDDAPYFPGWREKWKRQQGG